MIDDTKPAVDSGSASGKTDAASDKSFKAVTKDRFERIIDEVEDYAIISLNASGIISSWNRGAEKIKGYKAEEIIGKHFRLFYTRDEKEAKFPEQLLAKAAETGRANHEGWRLKKDGTRFWGSISITAIHDDNGHLTGFLKVTRDLTEKRIAEDSLSNYVEEIQHKNEELRKSQDRYQRMVEEIKDYAIIQLDPDGIVLEWNLGAEKVNGYKPKEIIGKSLRLFYTHDDRETRLPERLLKTARDLGSVTHEGWRVRKDGRRFWAYVAITALHNEKGEVFGYSKITRDLTDKRVAEDRISNYVEELKQKNEQLQQSEERYYRMIEEVEDYAIIFLDLDGYIRHWNAGAEKIKGYSREEAVGKNFRLFYTRADIENGLPEKLLQEALITGKVINEGYRLRKDGTAFWASVVITALHGKNKEVIGFTKVTRDLTERKAAEEALDLKNRDLEAANGQLSSFAFVASHDLKEPLRKIQVFASRISEIEQLSDRGQDHIQKILFSARRMQRLIDDLLSFSKLSRSEEPIPVDLNRTIADVRSDLEVSIHEKKATIRFDDLPTIRAIPFQMHQLFLNLFSNSLKFSNPLHPPEIRIAHTLITGPVEYHGVTENRNYHRLTISDNGIGFEPREGKRIFDVFYRLHPRDSFEGTGIGLAIVRKVVDNHKGFIAADGAPGAGARFSVYLPA